ncbi:hypothetical protein GWO62_01735 [Corynebacterium macginleyi]|nr:hypothetical protein [Corynebacterium macginleyi]
MTVPLFPGPTISKRYTTLLDATLFHTYPHNPIVPFSRTGAPDSWRELPLWRV